MSFSRWSDHSDRNMDQIIEGMLDYKNWHVADVDPRTNEDLRFHISRSFAENKTITLNGNDVYYNYIKYEYERVRPGEEQNELRTSRIYNTSGFIIIYSDGTNTQYITNRKGNDNTKTILRKINNYSGKREITFSPLHIQEDMFIWMIYRVLNSREESFEDDTELFIRQIIGFKGSTTDNLAAVMGTGNRIMNLLSTLAFLFENEQVTMIKPRVEYGEETIEILLDVNGTVDVDLQNYTGAYLLEGEHERSAIVLLMTFLEIIPKIITAYSNASDVDNEEWSSDKKSEFLMGIGETIQEKIKEKFV
ncbi:hypothetical protein COL72_08435 [Bacillus toyonensis]|uniref:hypothetical protein n=1 Tax=Bacillus toyonensis TaxID=155322 RepID=UPI000BF83E52|nr:hypothetical protein [Bacillus toyonensis]PFZ73690.1 hypothetical protein COL72_08435 [Bacillus toyonensis]